MQLLDAKGLFDRKIGSPCIPISRITLADKVMTSLRSPFLRNGDSKRLNSNDKVLCSRVSGVDTWCHFDAPGIYVIITSKFRRDVPEDARNGEKFRLNRTKASRVSGVDTG